MSEVKQIIVVRKDLKMRRGKECAQVAHASIAFLSRQLQGNKNNIKLSEAAREWVESSFKKVCVQVNSEEELLGIKIKAECAGLEVHLVTDAGLTEFKEPTNTCLAIGPDYSDKIDAITGQLKLY
jgi:PTH2 family peptidyl-tRNA hydrolase